MWGPKWRKLKGNSQLGPAMHEEDTTTWRSAAEVFHQWAIDGKDAGMEKGHGPAVEEMLVSSLMQVAELGKKFRALDIGCGNGWVTRKLAAHPHCIQAIGIDAAEAMIDKAKQIDGTGEYYHCDLMQWQPEGEFDLIHSMETMYYLKDPGQAIKRIASWLNGGGLFVMGVDHYRENEESIDWPQKVKTPMTLHSESEWKDLFTNAGLEISNHWRAAAKEGWAGTLVIIGRKV
tara:strand:+ start:118 stop:813 length:696 start_codon:yes stop_codon:yes gene_type:complete